MWAFWYFKGHSRSSTRLRGGRCQGYVQAFNVCKMALIADTFTAVSRGNVVKTPPINSYNGFCDFVPLLVSGVCASFSLKADLLGCSSGSCCADWPRQDDKMPHMHHWFMTFTGYQQVQVRKRQWWWCQGGVVTSADSTKGQRWQWQNWRR